MTTSRQWILAAASFLAFSLWVGTASGDGLDASSSPLDELSGLNQINELGSAAMETTTTGNSSPAIAATAIPTRSSSATSSATTRRPAT